MKCISCGANAEKGTTTDVTDLGNRLIIVRNVPCHKCTQCTEVMYRGDVVLKLEEIERDIKNPLSELGIFDYNNIVA